MNRWAECLFSGRPMLYLSLATIPGAVLQLFVDVGEPLALVLDLIDWTVIAIFAAEYFVRFRSALDRRAFVGGPSNILSLLVILLGVSAAVFSVPLLYSATVLRLLRTAKLFGDTGHSSADILAS